MLLSLGGLRGLLVNGAMYLAVLAVSCIALTDEVRAQSAEVHYRPQPQFQYLPPTEAKGCYYHHGERFCGSYCYWEVNGKRYCQRRERDAISQAPVYVEDVRAPTLK